MRDSRAWTHKYPVPATAVTSLGARQACVDGAFCAVYPSGITLFSMIQLEWLKDGSMLLSGDYNGAVYRITYRRQQVSMRH
jgi:hypothetical protein